MGILMLSYYHSDCVLGCLDCIRGAWQQMEKNHLGPASEQAFQAQIISADFSSFRALLGLRNHSRVWWGGEMRGCCISLIIDFQQLQSMSLKVSEAAELQTACCLECLGSQDTWRRYHHLWFQTWWSHVLLNACLDFVSMFGVLREMCYSKQEHVLFWLSFCWFALLS